jgi:K+-transporting ATPase ATPase A chain
MVALLTLAAAMVCTLGRYVKDLAHSRAILIAMTIMLVLGLCLAIGQELKPDPALAHLTSEAGNWEDQASSSPSPSGFRSMEASRSARV